MYGLIWGAAATLPLIGAVHWGVVLAGPLVGLTLEYLIRLLGHVADFGSGHYDYSTLGETIGDVMLGGADGEPGGD